METSLDLVWLTKLVVLSLFVCAVALVVVRSYFQRKLSYHRTIVRDLQDLSEGGESNDVEAQKQG